MAKKILLKISGMHCTTCAMSIEGDLEDTVGVKSAKASYAKQQCEVEFEEDKIEIKEIVSTIKATGYSASPVN